MTIDVYYIHVKKNKQLMLFTKDYADYNFLNRLLLSAQRLGNKPDEDIVKLKILESSELQCKIIISSDFLFTKMKKFSGAFSESVEDLLNANGVKLIPKVHYSFVESSLEQESIKGKFWCLFFGSYKKNKKSIQEEVRLLQEEQVVVNTSPPNKKKYLGVPTYPEKNVI